MKKLWTYFTPFEKILWLLSTACVTASFLLFDRNGVLSFVTSLIGVTVLILLAKGNPFGHALGIVFGILYAVISFSYAYYGEMITYLGMTVPMAVVSLITWFRHPYKENKTEVAVARVKPAEIPFALLLTAAVTALFYFVLKYLGTANLIPSTISVATSFIASYFSFRRSPYYALAYAANDLVLCVLWALATIKNTAYVSVLVCFAVFFFNDLYGFINWTRIAKRQRE